MKLERSFWEKNISWAVLLLLIVYTLGFVVEKPYAGFGYNQMGIVTEVFEPGVYGDLRKGDRLQQVGDVVWEEFRHSQTQLLFAGVAENEEIQLHVWRDKMPLVVAWRFPGRNWAELRQRLNSEWWLPYIFWLAGVATIWLIRPKGRLWRLLTGFHFLTAVWLVTGTLSSSHLWYSIFISHAALWLCLPLYWQLHLQYPQPLFSLPKWAIPTLYGAAGVGILLDWLMLLPAGVSSIVAFLAFGGSIVLLLAQAWRSEKQSEARRLLLLLSVGFVPAVIVMIATWFGVQPFFQGGALLGVVTIPGIYFVAAYRPQLPALRRRVRRLVKFYMVLVGGLTVVVLLLAFWVNWLDLETSTLWWGNVTLVLSLLPAVLGFLPAMSLAALAGAYYRTAVDPSARQLELVANRVFTPYLFVVLVVPAMILLALGLQFMELFTQEAVLASLVSSITAVLFTLLTYKRFEQWVEQFLFGLPPLPLAVVETYMNRLVTVPSRSALVQLLRDEVLQTLQVRESALFLVDEAQQVELLYEQGLDSALLPSPTVVLALMQRLQQQPTEWMPSQGWAQLLLPLRVQGRWLGVWLLGRRDPDGLYGQRDLPLYETLAAQTAVALINFTQSETLQMLYKMNIERHEQERLALAHDLHDVTLSELAVMAMYVNDGVSPKFHDLYRGITHHLRQIITGLRPKMLDFGLWAGLNQLVDVQMERLSPECELLFDLRQTAVRYPPHIEQEIYRIVQQALENAIAHAHAELIRIHGHLLADNLTIVVEDNGVGLPYKGQLPITRLLTEGHFGLVGMQERAAFIGAHIQFRSPPGEGTVISIVWQRSPVGS